MTFSNIFRTVKSKQHFAELYNVYMNTAVILLPGLWGKRKKKKYHMI